MRHASRKLAHRLHFLSLEKLLFGLAPLRDVLYDSEQGEPVASALANKRDRQVSPHNLARFGSVTNYLRIGFDLAGNQFGYVLKRRDQIPRIDKLSKAQLQQFLFAAIH